MSERPLLEYFIHSERGSFIQVGFVNAFLKITGGKGKGKKMILSFSFPQIESDGSNLPHLVKVYFITESLQIPQ